MKKSFFIISLILSCFLCFAQTTVYYKADGMVRNGAYTKQPKNSYVVSGYITFLKDKQMCYETNSDGVKFEQDYFGTPNFQNGPQIIGLSFYYLEDVREDGILVYKTRPVSNGYGLPSVPVQYLYVSPDLSRINKPFITKSGYSETFDNVTQSGTFIYQKAEVPKKQKKEPVPFY